MPAGGADTTTLPFLGSLLPYLASLGTDRDAFQLPMPGFTHEASPLASGGLGDYAAVPGQLASTVAAVSGLSASEVSTLLAGEHSG